MVVKKANSQNVHTESGGVKFTLIAHFLGKELLKSPHKQTNKKKNPKLNVFCSIVRQIRWFPK